MKKIAIVGGGVAGIAAAIELTKQPEIEVTIFEPQDLLKRILISGNGHCNIGNLNLDPSKYNNPSFMNRFFDSQTYKEDYLTYLHNLGIYVTSDNEGRLYPISNSSANVKEILLNNLGPSYKLIKRRVIKIISAPSSYELIDNLNESRSYDGVILATGGSSYDRNEADEIKILTSLSLPLTPLSPGLSPLKIKPEFSKDYENIRLQGSLKLYSSSNTLVYTDTHSEIIIKKGGIGGIGVMTAASFYNRDHSNKHLILNLLSSEILEVINKGLKGQTIEDFFKATFHLKLLPYFLHLLSLPKDTPLLPPIREQIKDALGSLKFTIIGTYPFKDSQVTVGGLELNALKDNSLELKDYRNLYAVGELLDIDGECGGYNIAFALLSGLKAAKLLRKELKL